MWIDLESVRQGEVSQKEKSKYILMLLYVIWIDGTDEPACRSGIEIH